MDRPNLLIVLSDQHSPHVAGGAGDPFARTPNLDRLSREGTRFRSAYCPAPLCVPSRMALLTGQFPCDLRIWTNSAVLSPQVPTFAHQLARTGYETVLCGRMHFVGEDQRHGFESRLVGDVSGGPRTGFRPRGCSRASGIAPAAGSRRRRSRAPPAARGRRATRSTTGM